MKRVVLFIAAFALSGGLYAAHAEDAKAYHGQISDSQCALNIHSLTRSHEEMLKSKHMGGTPAECALYCIQHLGGNLVLASKKDVYHLDNQNLAVKYVGKKVVVTGVLDSKNDTLHVEKIELEP
jgi:Protein of unknown function (DUF5818)